MTIITSLNSELEKVFDKLNYNKKYAIFQYSDRPDLSDFQTNCSMPLCKEYKKSPIEIAKTIVAELEQNNIFDKVTIDGPGFINVKVNEKYLLSFLNNIINKDKVGLEWDEPKKTVVIDFGGYNIAKEPHVGHLRSTVIGESIRRIYDFAGDKVISDVHTGDWGLNMGMVIQGIKLKYPNLKCFQDGFNEDTIDDLTITSAELTEVYRLATSKAKEDEEFAKTVHLTTKMLQDGYKPYRVLWQYFTDVCIKDLKSIVVDVFDAHFDLWNGESSVHELIIQMIRNLLINKTITISDGAKIIDLSEYDLPPVMMEKSDGAFMYASSDMATILDREQKYNPDIILYIVDYRQSLHFKQVFTACKKIGLLNEKHQAEHCPFGTMNGKDNKPYKTRSGDIVLLRYLVQETIDKIKSKSTNSNDETVKNIAVACIKFADLINYRESNYIFDLDQFTNYEGKTGAYLLYALVRINSILNSQEKIDYNITHLKTKEEKDLVMELTKFSSIFKQAYDKKAPNVIAEYVYTIARKFSTFYANCSINNEKDIEYKNSKISLLYLTKTMIETCLYLLGIRTIKEM